MNSILKVVMLLLAVFGMGACAYTPQVAVLQPNVNLVETNEGNGTEVLVTVVDERADKALGHRGGATIKGAKITTDQDIEALIRDEIFKGLIKKGFKPVNCNPDSKPNLKIEIRLLEYYTSTGFWTGGIHTKAALKAISDSNGKFYENIYRVDNEERVVVVPTAETNEKFLNQLISDILLKLFQDQKLISSLVQA